MKTPRMNVARLVPLLVLLALSPFALWSCTDAGDEPGSPTGSVTEYNPEIDYPSATISMNLSTTTQAPGDTFTAVATYRDANGLPITGAPLVISAEIACFSTSANPAYTDGSGKTSFEVTVIDGCPEGSYQLAVYTSNAEPLSGPNTIGYFGVKVVEGNETISTPAAPTGPISIAANSDQTFYASGAESSLDHSLQYQFQWGDGAQSLWIDADAANQASGSYKYASFVCADNTNVTESNEFQVRVQARCATDTAIVSEYSESLTVTVTVICN